MPGYRGRHRKPSNTGKNLAKTAIAGAVIGVPLAGAGQAHAAPDEVWDRVAKCESGNDWAINTGNGFQGGLQFTPSTWRGFGGTRFANAANKASREQQILIAERVLARQGWNAWPVCSRKAGATGSKPTPRVITVKAPVKKPDKPKAPAPKFRGKHALAPGAPAVPLPAPAPLVPEAGRLEALPDNDNVAKPLTAMPIAPLPVPSVPSPAAPAPAEEPLLTALAAPEHGAPPPAGQPAPKAPAAPQPAAPAPQPAAPAAPAPRAPAPAGQRTYQVRPGDTLSGIATAQGVAGGWRAIYQANRGTIGNANLIHPGQQLSLG